VTTKTLYARALIAAACAFLMAFTGMAQELPAQNAQPQVAPAQNPPAASEPAPAASPESQPAPPQTPPASGTISIPPSGHLKEARQPTESERRRASRLFLSAAKLYEQGKFEEALRGNEQALALDPGNDTYRMAVEVARSHAVTALIQSAAKARIQGDTLAARAMISHAYQIDPRNPELAPHLGELADNPLPDDLRSQRNYAASGLGEMERLVPAPGSRNFHFRTNQRQVIQEVFKAYGIQTTVDESIRGQSIRFDLEDATFVEATHALSMATKSFFVPIDAHRVVVALDTREYRAQYTRNGVETVYLSGLNQTEMTDIGNLARNIFEVSQTAVNPTAGTLTLRAPQIQLDAFNATFQSLMDGRSQVLLDVKLIQIAHNNAISTGVTPPQQVTAFNVSTEVRNILNANQDLVKQIIAAGLAAPGDDLAIVAILLASGQASSPLLQSGGVLIFGGGSTLTGITIKPLTVSFNLNSSDSRALDQFQLRLGDGEESTLKSGSRYPIQTSSYSNLGGLGNLNIPGLNTAGNSGSLSGLLGGAFGGGGNGTIPMIQYEDLGLTLKATPSILRSGDVALKIDMKINALAGSAINGVPILASRAWSGVSTVPQNQAIVVASEIDSNESHAISGWPGLSEGPGLNNITSKDTQKNYSTLLIVMTPHVVRSPRMSDHTNMVHIERNFQTR